MRRALWLLPVLVAAGIALVFHEGGDPEPPPGAAPHPAEEAEVLYERAIGDLETEFRDRGDDAQQAISPELAALDQVIAEGRRVARAAPDDEDAQQTLLQSLARKLELLHNTLMLMRDMERGDGEAARDRIEDLAEREPPEPPPTG